MSDLRRKRPRLLEARIAGLRLTAEERLVLARIDGERTIDDLSTVTGLEAGRLERIVSKLALDGALDLREAPPEPEPQLGEGHTSFAELAAAVGMDPTAFGGAPAKPKAKAQGLRRYTPVEPLPVPVPVPVPVPAPDPDPDPAPDPDPDPDPAPDPDPDPDRETSEERGDRERAEKDDESAAVAERNYRQVFETRWRALRVDERAAAARTSSGPDLLALCFDPDPRVIAAIFENATAGLDHARLVSFHHRTGTGLEVLARRRDWLRDLLVERRLLRNPMIGDVVLGRVMGPKRLLPTYKVAIDREVPELTRAKSRGHLRKKWTTAAPEERAELLLRTEARCLTLMTGCTFDAKTTAILCGRPINSVMFVQSIAKFPGSPPGLLAHLYKQPFVRKNAPLRKLLLSHPNMPGDVKRSL